MATTTVRKADIEPSMSRVVGRQRHRSKVQAATTKDYYKRELTITFSAHLVSKMDTYLDLNDDVAMFSLLCILPALLVSSCKYKPLYSTL